MIPKEELADEILIVLDEILQIDWNFEEIYKRRIIEAMEDYRIEKFE